jgi:hypothetical protein
MNTLKCLVVDYDLTFRTGTVRFDPAPVLSVQAH